MAPDILHKTYGINETLGIGWSLNISVVTLNNKTMNKFMLTTLTIALFGLFSAFTSAEAPAPEAAPAWNLDKVHTSVDFTIRHFFTEIAGHFSGFDAELNFDPADLAGSSVGFTVEVASVDTRNESRDGHIQGGDFFDAGTYPQMTFKSSSFKKGSGEQEYLVTGSLQIRDVVKEVTLPVTFLGAMENPMKAGSYVAGFKTTFKLNRTDYGVGTGDWASTAVIGDEVNVTVNVEANR